MPDWETTRPRPKSKPCKECPEPMTDPRRLVITNYQSPGDILMLTAAVRDLHLAYPGQYITDVRTSCAQLWEHNPHITRFTEPWIDEECQLARDTEPATPRNRDDVMIIPASYPLVHRSNQEPVHFVTAFHRYLESVLDIDIPVSSPMPDVYLSDAEKTWMSQVAQMRVNEPFWIMVTGGKWDATAKWPNPHVLQEVVNHFGGKILFVQAGANGDWQPELTNTINLVGQTDLRMLVRLVYHSSGVICPVTALMHLAAAVPVPEGRTLATRPCVVIAGGREPTHWEAYSTHRYLSTQGCLTCNTPAACWKSRSTPVGDGDDKDNHLCENTVKYKGLRSFHANQQISDLQIPKCIDIITAQDIIRAIEMYQV